MYSNVSSQNNQQIQGYRQQGLPRQTTYGQQFVVPPNQSPHGRPFQHNQGQSGYYQVPDNRPMMNRPQTAQRPMVFQQQQQNHMQQQMHQQRMVQMQQQQNRQKQDYQRQMSAMQQQPPRPMSSTPQPPIRPSANSQLPFNLETNNTNYILYHSNFCLHSKELLQALCKTPFYEKFQKINISDGSCAIPGFLKEVPTAIVPGMSRPLQGKEIQAWLEQQAQQKSSEAMKEIVPYLPDEMGSGFGDSYSYLDVEEREQPMEHMFAFIDREAPPINTPPEEEFGEKKPEAAQINANTRPPMPQVPQMQGSHGMNRLPIVPQNSGGGDKHTMKKAYEDLLARRAADTPKPPPQGNLPPPSGN